MKKRVIALSVTAALGSFVGAANAQVPPATDLIFTPNGVGHIVIVPYFSTQGGNATLINLVNTDEVNGKAVKIRFRGASNSDDVFDFQLFMSPGDVWTANISRGADGKSRLTTVDNSCTLPSKAILNATPFITSRLNPDLSDADKANETREGYVEIFTMADIPSSSVTSSVYAVTKHNTAGTASCTASVLEGLTQGDTRLVLPTRGLMANWTIINVPQTTTWSGDAAAIVGVDPTGTPGTGLNVFWPQTATALTQQQITDNTSDAAFLSGLVEAASYDLPDLSTPYTSAVTDPTIQANNLSHALAVRKVAGEYLSDPTIGATTDWVVSMPTRRYYVAVDYSAVDPEDKLLSTRWIADSNAVYFSSKYIFSDGNSVMGSAANGGKTYQICVQVGSVKFYNREEVSPSSSGIVISPGQPAPAPSLCGEVSVVGINSPNSPLNASVARTNLQLPGGLLDGWGWVTANNTVSGVDLGLPMLVREFVKATNPAVSAGVSGTFGATWSARRLIAGEQW
jgi:hypothetical protein